MASEMPSKFLPKFHQDFFSAFGPGIALKIPLDIYSEASPRIPKENPPMISSEVHPKVFQKIFRNIFRKLLRKLFRFFFQ